MPYTKDQDLSSGGYQDDRLSYTIFDSILSFLLLFLTSPLFVIVIFLVIIDGTGHIFYLQDRYGKNKMIFKIYKFRSMHKEAENGRPIWGMEADPRSSSIGKFLRVTHLDELPQLINVVKGQMSLVGPRPERPYFAEKFKALIPEYEERHSVKPGLTGWAQVNGLRGESCVKERTVYDIFYVRNRSLLLNFKIILLTPLCKPIKHNHPHHQKRRRQLLFLGLIPSLFFS